MADQNVLDAEIDQLVQEEGVDAMPLGFTRSPKSGVEKNSINSPVGPNRSGRSAGWVE